MTDEDFLEAVERKVAMVGLDGLAETHVLRLIAMVRARDAVVAAGRALLKFKDGGEVMHSESCFWQTVAALSVPANQSCACGMRYAMEAFESALDATGDAEHEEAAQ